MLPDKDSELINQQLSALINLYEHHLDLFWKWITLYATVVTAIGVYIFNKDIAPSTKPIFPILIAVASLGIALGCFIMLSWLKELESEFKRLSNEVDALGYPSFLGIKMTMGALIASVIFAAFNVLYSIFGTFY